ncbi:MAG: NAD(P)H-quinone oxidoreductase [Clostridia bacterium]|nr:NAD(P)H-quinone oxidoreductase [Clostridia bacterium]
MKAIVIKENDRSLCYTDVPDPTPKTGEVLIEVYAAALNRADLLQREGSYPPPPGCPPWPGLEVAGVVAATGPDAHRFCVGDRVCALLGGGGYAEYVTVDERMVMPLPEPLSFVEAAAIPEVYTTAYLNLFHVGEAKEGETLLMHAGASGLASAVIPMAKAAGLRVITTVRGQTAAESIADLGADLVVDTEREDIADVLRREERDGRPVDLTIDCLGGDALGRSLPYVARGCRWIVIATLAGDVSPVDFRNVYVKNIRLIGSTLRSKTPAEKGDLLRELVDRLWPIIRAGRLRPRIFATFPLREAEAAHRLLYSGAHVGKVVLTVKENAEEG